VTAVDQPPPSRRTWLKWGGLILAGVVAAAYCWVAVVVPYLRPAFESVDAVDAGQVRSLTVFVLNRPDGGPDIGHPKNPFAIDPADYGKVLGLLRNAERIDKERGVYLGEMRVRLADGRRQSIQLYRVAPAPNAPPVLRFKIEQFQYEAGPADRLVTLLAECEARAKAASG
jgi:hypothetical protein